MNKNLLLLCPLVIAIVFISSSGRNTPTETQTQSLPLRDIPKPAQIYNAALHNPNYRPTIGRSEGSNVAVMVCTEPTIASVPWVLHAKTGEDGTASITEAYSPFDATDRVKVQQIQVSPRGNAFFILYKLEIIPLWLAKKDWVDSTTQCLVTIQNMDHNSNEKCLYAAQASVSSSSFAQDGSKLALVDDVGAVTIRSTLVNRVYARIPAKSRWKADCFPELAFTPDEEYLVIATSEKGISYLDRIRLADGNVTTQLGVLPQISEESSFKIDFKSRGVLTVYSEAGPPVLILLNGWKVVP